MQKSPCLLRPSASAALAQVIHGMRSLAKSDVRAPLAAPQQSATA
jgi:hypothetical protein